MEDLKTITILKQKKILSVDSFSELLEKLNDSTKVYFVDEKYRKNTLFIQNIDFKKEKNALKYTLTNISYKNHIIDSIVFDNCNFDEIELNSFNHKHISFKNSSINNFNIVGNSNHDSIKIHSSEIGIFNFSCQNPSANLYLYKSSIGRFTLENSVLEFLDVDDCDFGVIRFLKNYVNRLTLSNSKTIHHISLTDCTTNQFSVKNVLISELLRISSSTINEIELSNIFGYSIELNLNVNDVENLKSFNLTNCILKKIISSKLNGYSILIDGSYIDDFEILPSEKLSIEINKSNIINSKLINQKNFTLKIIDSTIGEPQITNSAFINPLIIEYSKIHTLVFDAIELKKVLLEGSYFQHFTWKQISICNIFSNNCEFRFLNFHQTIIPKDSVFQFNNSSVNVLSFENLVNIATFSFSYLSVGKLNYIFEEKLEDSPKVLTVNENITLNIGKHQKEISFNKMCFNKNDKLFNSSFTILNSDLGKTNFLNSNLNEFKKFYYQDSKMLELFISNTTLPKNIETPLNPHLKFNSNYDLISSGESILYDLEQQKTAFSQFKKIHENRGDSISALEYYSLELEKYREILKLKLKQENITQKEKNKISTELFSIGINHFSSNHGTDWAKSFINTLWVTLLFYSIYCWLNGYLPFGTSMTIFWELASNIFDFLNPFPKNSTFENTSETSILVSISKIWAGLSRIVIAYFVYQTIQSFRKFGKKI